MTQEEAAEIGKMITEAVNTAVDKLKETLKQPEPPEPDNDEPSEAVKAWVKARQHTAEKLSGRNIPVPDYTDEKKI